MTAPVPAELMGLWRREVIIAPGLRDETTQVFWLQTPTWYADIRVAADRPGPRSPAGFAGFRDAELLELAKIQGFAGELSAGGGICLWRRDLDRQPPGPIPDEARYGFDGPDVMIEDGVHADYQEIWRRVAGSDGPFAAFRLAEPEGRGGLLVIAGEHLIEFRARAGAPLAGESLAALVEARLAAGDRPGAENLLDTRIRYAVQTAVGWKTRLSTHPWLEERLLWPESAVWSDASRGDFQVAGEGGPEVWSLLDASVAGEALGRLLAGRRDREPVW
jgi:hypothetical protein